MTAEVCDCWRFFVLNPKIQVSSETSKSTRSRTVCHQIIARSDTKCLLSILPVPSSVFSTYKWETQASELRKHSKFINRKHWSQVANLRCWCHSLGLYLLCFLRVSHAYCVVSIPGNIDPRKSADTKSQRALAFRFDMNPGSFECISQNPT